MKGVPAVRMAVPLLVLLLPVLAPGCAATDQEKSAREWQRAECNRIIDPEARERCLKRVQ